MTTKTASVSGLWSNTATWGGSAVPIDGDTVVINQAITVYYDGDQSGFTTGMASYTMSQTTTNVRFVTPNMNGSGYLPYRNSTVAVQVTSGTSVQVADAICSSALTGTASGTTAAVVNGALFRAGQAITVGDTGGNEIAHIVSISGNTLTTTSLTGTYHNTNSGYVSSFVVGQTVCIQTLANPSTVFEINAIAAVAPSNTLTLANAVANTYAVGAPLFVLNTYMKFGPNVTIGVYGGFYVGNSPTALGEQIPRPVPVIGQAYTNVVTLQFINPAAATISGTLVYMYGWVPTTPTGHPNYTTLAYAPGHTSVDNDTLWLTDNLGLQPGEQIVVGNGAKMGPTTETNLGLYTVLSYTATGGTHNNQVVLTAGMQTTDGVRLAGDFVAWYSRPIKFYRSGTYSSTLGGSASVMQGVQLYNLRLGTTPTTCEGITFDGATQGTVCVVEDATGGSVINDSTVTNCGAASGLIIGPFNSLLVGCAAINLNSSMVTTYTGGAGLVCVNCASQNCNGFASGVSETKLYNCIGRSNLTCGLVKTCPSALLVNCTGQINTGSAFDIWPGQVLKMDGCVLSQSTLASKMYQYNAASRPVWSTIQHRNANGSPGTYELWGRGGYGATSSSVQYNGASPIHFTVNAANTPLFWDTEFWMPANKTLTLTVPMRKDYSSTTCYLQIIDPNNDPLWGGGGTPVAQTQMTDNTNTWNTVSVTVPSNATPRKLVMRVSFRNTVASGNAYAYISVVENELIKRVTRYV